MGTCSYELDHFCNTGGGFRVENGAERGIFEKYFEFFSELQWPLRSCRALEKQWQNTH